MKLSYLNYFFVLSICLSCSSIKKVSSSGIETTKTYPSETPFPEIKIYSDEHLEFSVIQKSLTFLSCDSIGKNSEREKCFNETIKAHFENNITYPKIAKANGIQGVVKAKFRIDPKGKITHIAVSGNEYLLDEAIRLLNTLPEIIPEKFRGKGIEFKIETEITFTI